MANRDWAPLCFRRSIKRDVSNAGEERIGHFDQGRTLHSIVQGRGMNMHKVLSEIRCPREVAVLPRQFLCRNPLI